MKFEFDPTERLIQVTIDLLSENSLSITGALDTGATFTVLSQDLFDLVGSGKQSREPSEVVTAGGTILAWKAFLPAVRCLGREVTELEVLVARLPENLGVQVLLGKNFFKNSVLTIDFANGYLELTEE